MDNWWEEYKVDVPEGQSGNWKVERFEITEDDAKLQNTMAQFSFTQRGRFIKPGIYTSLLRGGTPVMSDTPAEIRDHLGAIQHASGHCLVNGLGLGMVVQAMLERLQSFSDQLAVEKVTVIEKSEDVIKLVAGHYAKKYGDRIEIINADAFEYKPPKGIRYGAVWHDIWDVICPDNKEQMSKLHRKYGRRADWQSSWRRQDVMGRA